MDLLDEVKQTYKTVSCFMERMDTIEKGCRSHLELLKTAEKKERKKVEANFKNFVDSLRTKGDKNETPKIRISHLGNPEAHSKIPQPHSQHELEDHSDDDFLRGPACQKPKKPLCLSIKKSAKNRSKSVMEKRLLDGIPDEEQAVPHTPRTKSDSRERGKLDETTPISISWTIKIKESSTPRINQVRITGSEGVNQTPTALRKSQKLESSISYELEDEAKTLETAEPSRNMETCDGLGNEDIKNTSKNFGECRVVVRKLSTSHKIFQPKVVLRKLTDDEISKIRGVDSQKPTLPTTGEPLEPTVRYTSLILEPARKFPWMFSTVKMRCSVMKLVLTPPQGGWKSDTKKTVEPTSSNDMVKSMYKTKSKCVQGWRATRTKETGRWGLPRKSLELRQETNTGAALTDKAVTTKHGQETKRSKCNQGWRSKSRTKDILECRPRHLLGQRKFKSMTSSKSDRGQEFKTIADIQENQSTCNKSEQEQRNTEERKEFKTNKITCEPHSPNHDCQSNLRKPETYDVVIQGKIYDPAVNCLRACDNDSTRELKLSEDKTDKAKRQFSSHQKHKSKHLTHAWKDQAFKNVANKSQKKMVLITPTRLKYSVKTRPKSVQNSPIQNGRVTRSRIEIQHSGTDSASRSKSGNMFPGSQLTFLIESFRR